MDEQGPVDEPGLRSDPSRKRVDSTERRNERTSDAGAESYRTTFDVQNESVGVAVVSAVAAVSNTDPLELEPLYHLLDMEALDALFRPDSTGHVTFPYGAYDVVIRSDGEITVTWNGR